MNLETYKKTNEAFKLLCVYHLGVRSGFFSEYNNMVWAMLYCLRCGIGFTLATRDANFAVKKGWQDYFLPFCPERQSWLHHRWLHPRFPKEHSLKFAFQDKVLCDLIKQIEKVDALTHEIWNGMRRQHTGLVDLPELGIHGDFREIVARLVDITWRFNPETQNILDTRRAALNLPARYIGIHIRGGDKRKESELHDPSEYIEKARAISGLRDIFVMSDDHANIETLRQRYPDFRFFTLTPQTAAGYHHRKHARKSKKERHEENLVLFTEIETMRRAEAVVCTFTSNLGVFLGMAMPTEKCHALDGEWRVW